MTAKRDLKRRVRERQARTGESYMTALRQVRARRSAGKAATETETETATVTETETEPGGEAERVPVVEMIDITEIASTLGFRCPTMLSPTLADRVDVATVLRQLRDALVATARDPAFAILRAVIQRGEHPAHRAASGDEVQRFMVRARAGIGGVSEHGTMLALATRGRERVEMVLFLARLMPAPYRQQPPVLLVGSLDGMLVAGNVTLAWR